MNNNISDCHVTEQWISSNKIKYIVAIMDSSVYYIIYNNVQFNGDWDFIKWIQNGK